MSDDQGNQEYLSSEDPTQRAEAAPRVSEPTGAAEAGPTRGRGGAGGLGGLVFPSPVVLLSIVAVAMAAVAFFATRGSNDERRVAIPAADSSTSASSDPSPSAEPTRQPKPIKRGHYVVDVWNYSGVTGLAGRTSTQATTAGWKQGTVGNWTTQITTNTVFFPDGYRRAAKQLGLDLGVAHLAKASSSMPPDRLTVVLATDLN